MTTKTNLNKKTSEFEVVVTANAQVWKDQLAHAFDHLVKNLAVKGFRKGQVPADLAKKHIAKADIYAHSIQHMLDIMVKEAAKEITEDVMVLDSPTYNVENINDETLVVKFIYPVYPEVKLPDYKALGVKFHQEEVTEKTVEDELEKIAESQASMKTKEGAIANGDVAVFDFEGFVNGVAFDGGKAERYELEIGSGQFIPGFEDQMVGLSASEAKDVNVTFPEAYHSEELKGKPAVFKVKIHEVKAKVKPVLDDAFAKSIEAPGVETLAQLRDYIKTVFTEQARQQARAKFQRESFDKILETADFIVPAGLVANEMKQVASQFEQSMKQQGITLEQYFQFTGMDRVKMDAQFRQQAEKRLRDALVFAEIAKAEKIELTDADYEAEYEKLAKVYMQSVDGIRGVISKAQMQIPMTNDRVIDALIAFNK